MTQPSWTRRSGGPPTGATSTGSRLDRKSRPRPRLPLILAVLVIGTQLPWVRYGPLAGLLIGMLTCRGWWQVLQAIRWGKTCFFLGLAAIGSGIVLVLAAPDPYLVTPREAIFTLLFIASQLAGALVAAYARVRLGLSITVAAYSAGALLQGLYLAPTADDPWKFDLGLPVGVAVVLMVSKLFGRLAAVASLLVFAGISVASDARSLAAFFVLAAFISTYGLFRGDESTQPPTRRQSYFRRAVLMLSLGYGLYQAGVRLAVNGSLGSSIEQRTAEQLALAGSVIEAGRPEWAATTALFMRDPWGIGPGVRLTLSQLGAARTALAERGVASGGAYVNDYLFTSSVRLHAVIADLWVNLGLFGAAVGLVILALLGRALLASAESTSRVAPAYTVLVIAALWYLFFGPMLSNLPGVAVAAGLSAGSLALRRIRPEPART